MNHGLWKPIHMSREKDLGISSCGLTQVSKQHYCRFEHPISYFPFYIKPHMEQNFNFLGQNWLKHPVICCSLIFFSLKKSCIWEQTCLKDSVGWPIACLWALLKIWNCVGLLSGVLFSFFKTTCRLSIEGLSQ